MTQEPTVPALDRELAALGFAAAGRGCFVRGPFMLEVGDCWLTLRAPKRAGPIGPDVAWFGRPGLWKPGEMMGMQVCDLPRRACAPSGDEHGESVLAQVIEWALATRDARRLPMPRDDTDGGPDVDGPEPWAVPARARTARAGALTCQGELHRDPDGTWIDYRLAAIPADPEPARRAWLEALVSATHRFRMAGVALQDEATGDGASLHARIDLRGLGPPARDALVAEALPRLRAVVERLLPAVDLLTDAGAAVVSRALELGTPRGTPTLPTRGPQR